MKEELERGLSKRNSIRDFTLKSRALEDVTAKINAEQKRIADLEKGPEDSASKERQSNSEQNNNAIPSTQTSSKSESAPVNSESPRNERMEVDPTQTNSKSEQQSPPVNSESPRNERKMEVDSTKSEQQSTPVISESQKKEDVKGEPTHTSSKSEQQSAPPVQSKPLKREHHYTLRNSTLRTEQSRLIALETKMATLEKELENSRLEVKDFKETTIKVAKWVGGTLLVGAAALGAYLLWKRYKIGSNPITVAANNLKVPPFGPSGGGGEWARAWLTEPSSPIPSLVSSVPNVVPTAVNKVKELVTSTVQPTNLALSKSIAEALPKVADPELAKSVVAEVLPKAVDLAKQLVPISVNNVTATWRELMNPCRVSHKDMLCYTGFKEWTLNWTAPPEATGFWIYRNGELIAKLGANVLSYVLQAKSKETNLFQIMAIGPEGTQSIPVVYQAP